jgi:hypothetical protein
MERRELSEAVESLQNLLVSYATGGPGNELEFRQYRETLLAEPTLATRLPRFIKTNRDLRQFWAFIKKQSPTYQGRREFLWSEFRPLLEELEANHSSPSEQAVTDALAVLNSDTVHEAWRRALDRRYDDPDAALTSARSLLETVCKHILDADGKPYDDKFDLPKLWKVTADNLNVAPSAETEPTLRQIFSGCISVVQGIGTLRSKLGDAHGKGASAPAAEPRHAELAVNLAGAVATFLIATWEAEKSKGEP